MKTLILASVLLLQAIISSVYAQQPGDTIKGIVKREFAPGYRMAFVPIFERDSANHIVSISTTDSEGRFSIQLQNPDDMIEVYCSGYQNNRFSIDSLFLELIMEPITDTSTPGLPIPLDGDGEYAGFGLMTLQELLDNIEHTRLAGCPEIVEFLQLHGVVKDSEGPVRAADVFEVSQKK